MFMTNHERKFAQVTEANCRVTGLKLFFSIEKRNQVFNGLAVLFFLQWHSNYIEEMQDYNIRAKHVIQYITEAWGYELMFE